MERGPFRSPLARAIGLGSAKKGAQHWLAERLTAVALVPLSLWFVHRLCGLYRLAEDAARD